MSTAAPAPDRSRTVFDPRPSVRWLIELLAVANLAVLAAMAFSGWWQVDRIDRPEVFWLLMGLMLVAELRPAHHTGPANDLAGAAPWILAGSMVLLGAPALAVLTLTAATFIGEILRQQPLLHGQFNASQLALSIAAGAAVLRALGQHEALTAGGEINEWWLPAALLAGVAVISVNGLLTGVVRAMSTGAPVLRSVASASNDTVRNDGLLLALAPIMAVLAVRSPLLLPLPLLTAWTVYRKAGEADERAHDANHDTLTGLPNRRRFHEVVEGRLAVDVEGAVALIDLDEFKAVNDHHGHKAGDDVLRNVAERIEARCGGHDVPARLGGDEFAVFFEGDPEAVKAKAVELVAALRQPMQLDDVEVEMGASLGLALVPVHGHEFDTLMERADATMYLAKREQRGVAVYDPGSVLDTRWRARLQNSLRRSLDEGRFDAHFQPWVDGPSGTVLGIEALARWPHAETGMLTPDQFLPLMRDTELATRLTTTMLNRALHRCRQWHEEGFEYPVSVNVSPLALRDPAFATRLQERLRHHGVEPRRLALEISDRGAGTGDPEIVDRVLEVRQLGVGLVLDDFGAGEHSLAHLADLGATTAKLDPALSRGMVGDQRLHAVVRHVVELGRELGVTVVAKRVETAAVAQAVAALGGGVQGHLVSVPLPTNEITDWLVERRRERQVNPRDPSLIPRSGW